MIRRRRAKRRTEPTAEDLARFIDLRVAHRIRERRRQLGMTQQHLARVIGVAFQQAYKYEHGISRVSAGRLFHIARALRAPIAYFFSGDASSAATPEGVEHGG